MAIKKKQNFLFLILCLLIFLSIIFNMYKYSKSEEVIEINVYDYLDVDGYKTINFEIKTEDEKNFIALPDKIDDKKVEYYYIKSLDEDEYSKYLPYQKYYNENAILKDYLNIKVKYENDNNINSNINNLDVINENQQDQEIDKQEDLPKKIYQTNENQIADPNNFDTYLDYIKYVLENITYEDFYDLNLEDIGIDLDNLEDDEIQELLEYLETKDQIKLAEIGEFSGGSGTVADPYRISTIEDMQELADCVNQGLTDDNSVLYCKKKYILTNDIDYRGQYLTPIGQINLKNNNLIFNGEFNGNGYCIKNARLKLDQIENTNRHLFGIFTALYGVNSSNIAKIYNLELDNIEVESDFAISTSPNCDIAIGVLVGNQCQCSEIKNCIIKNSRIKIGNNFVLRNTKLLAIGGVVGDITLTITSNEEITTAKRYRLENIYSNVDIVVSNDTTALWGDGSTTNRYYQYNIGGIVGRIRQSKILPENCIYTGKIKSINGIIGPIFANARFSTDATVENMYKPYIAEDNKGNLFGNLVNCYFYDYQIQNDKNTYVFNENYQTQYEPTILDGATIYTLGTTQMKLFQGLNFGTYLESQSAGLNMFNQYAQNNSYLTFYLDKMLVHPTFKNLPSQISASIVKNRTHNYSLVATSTNPEDKLTYTWSLDFEDLEDTSDTITITNGEIRNERRLDAYIYVNGVYSFSIYTLIEPEVLNLNIRKDTSGTNLVLVTSFSGTLGLVTTNYSFRWYGLNEETNEYEYIGANANLEIIPEFDHYDMLKIIATSRLNPTYDIEKIIKITDVIFVCKTKTTVEGTVIPVGNDANDGKTPQKAVQTLEQAYNLLDPTNRYDQNIIVIIGLYEDADITNVNLFTKKATITSLYQDIEYKGEFKLKTSKFIRLKADTAFSDITINYSNGTEFFYYCQGNDIIFDKNVINTNIKKAQTGWGFGNTTANYSAVCVVGGWEDYNNQEYPQEQCHIIIRSGAFGRVMGGSRTLATLPLTYCMGTFDNPFNVEIIIDIEDEETNRGTYDKSVGLLIGGQPDGNGCINTKINILNGGVGRLIGGSLGYGTRDYKDNPRDTFYGTVEINVKGGIVSEIFGGSYGRNEPTTYVYGRVVLNLEGGIIENNIFAAGAGGVTGYSTLSSDNYKSRVVNQNIYDLEGNQVPLDHTKVELNISKNIEIFGSVYGGGYGYSVELPTATKIARDGGSFYGEVVLNIDGGIMHQDVYAGGKGTDFYGTSRQELAQIHGDVIVNLTGAPIIYGHVYGGGEGINNYLATGKIFGDSTINIHDISMGTVQVTDIFGGGKGTSANITGNTIINVRDSEIYGTIYGSGDAADTLSDSFVNITHSSIRFTIHDGQDVGGQVYGGGKGSLSVVHGQSHVDIDDESVIEGRVCGGGDNGLVVEGTNVIVHGGSNVVRAVYGGGNEADVGTLANFQNNIFATTYVLIENAYIGDREEESVVFSYGNGEVFGGGNFGTVYGNTQATVGSINPLVETYISSVFYAGGRGNAGQTTVHGSSNAYINGINTVLNSYGDISLGEVTGDVNINFNSFRSRSSSNKYEYMTGINKATNLRLNESYIYLTGGIVHVDNIYLPFDTGIMISENSEIFGDFYGGGDIYLQNEICFIVDGNFYDSTYDTDPKITTLVLNPELLEEERCYILTGNIYNPYIVIRGNDYSSGLGIVSGNKKYDIYSLHKDHQTQTRYNLNSTSFVNSGASDINGTIYKNEFDDQDPRNYYYDTQNSCFYILCDDLELRCDEDLETTPSTDTIYYIECDIKIECFYRLSTKTAKDKIYLSEVNDEPSIIINQNGGFTSEIEIAYTMVKDDFGNFMDSERFLNVTRTIQLINDEIKYKFEVGTAITMISNNTRYYYIINQDNYNSQENGIALCDFVDENGNNYSEVNDVQHNLTVADEIVSNVYEYTECFRFIVDFLLCDRTLNTGYYDLAFLIDDDLDEDESIYNISDPCSFKVEKRGFNANIELARNQIIYNQNLELSGRIRVGEVSIKNDNDFGKDLVARFILKNQQGDIIYFPVGTTFTYNDESYNISEYVDLITNVQRNEYILNCEFNINMNDVPLNLALDDGNYILEFDIYVFKDGVVTMRKPIYSQEYAFKVHRFENYGLQITGITTNDHNQNDTLQLIDENRTVRKTVNLNFESGNLPDGTYLKVKIDKRLADGSFEYNTIDTNILAQEIYYISNSQTLNIDLFFDTSINNGTYRAVFELYDLNDNKIDNTFVNFIVDRN